MTGERPGPPPVKEGEGAAALASTSPVYTVTLDAGALRAVWEIAEARGKPGGATEASKAFNRAVAAFREAYWTKQEQLESVAKGGVVRKVARRPSKKTARKH